MADDWSDDHIELLLRITTLSGWYVDAENLPLAGDVVRAGLARAYDDYEGPQLARTDKGINFLKARGLIVPDAEAPFSPWSRTTPQPYCSSTAEAAPTAEADAESRK